MSRRDDPLPPLRAWTPFGVFMTLIAVGLVALWIRGAETPFGIGNGRVPDVVGRDLCSATRALTERGLRWGYATSTAISATALNESREATPDCSTDIVLRQSPRPGTDVGDGGAVRLATRCSDKAQRGGGCA